MIPERREKERCLYCGGEEMRYVDSGVIRKLCILCGKDFVARRQVDTDRFKEISKEFNQ